MRKVEFNKAKMVRMKEKIKVSKLVLYPKYLNILVIINMSYT